MALAFYLLKPRSTGLKLVELHGSTMGTSYTIKLVFPDDQTYMEPKEAQKMAEDIFEDINDKMSTYIPGSELSLFNRYLSTKPLEASKDLQAVLNASLKVSSLSNGAFDPTIGPLVNLWGFGPSARPDKVPSLNEIKAMQKKVGWQKLKVTTSSGKIQKKQKDLDVDLSAIAKGFAVDQVFLKLKENKNLNGLYVEVGGEIRVFGRNHRHLWWRIGINKPSTQVAIQEIVELAGGVSMATSGSYRNYFEEDGKRYSHTIHPKTGKPIDHKLVSVSVVHQSCMVADALATAIMVLGPQQGADFSKKNGLKIYMLIKTQSGYTVQTEGGFERLIKKKGS